MSTIDAILATSLLLIPVTVLAAALMVVRDAGPKERAVYVVLFFLLSAVVGAFWSDTSDHVATEAPLVPVDTLILARRASDTIPDTLFIYKIKPSERKRSDQVDGHLHREDEGDLSQEGR